MKSRLQSAPMEVKVLKEFFENSFVGKVEFDLGEISHPQVGTVHVKGEFPRIKPRNERITISTSDFESMQSTLNKWATEFFDMDAQPEYFISTKEIAVALAAYGNPFHALGSKKMEMNIKFFFWIFVLDDTLDVAIQMKVPFKVLEDGFSKLLKVLQNSEECAIVELFPGFCCLYRSIVNIHRQFSEDDPTWKDRVGPLSYYFQRAFAALRWYAVQNIDKKFTEETFQYWRNIMGFVDGTIEIIWAIDGGILPGDIRKSPSLFRLIDMVNSCVSIANDLLGVRKEINFNVQTDNILLFKICEKGIDGNEAVTQLCQQMENQMRDYVLIRNAILEEFSFHPTLVRYIDFVEAFFDGHNRTYLECARYLSTGQVKLID